MRAMPLAAGRRRRPISWKSRACERSSAGRFAATASGWWSYIAVAADSMRATIGATAPVPKRRASQPRTRTRRDGRSAGTSTPAARSFSSQSERWRSSVSAMRR